MSARLKDVRSSAENLYDLTVVFEVAQTLQRCFRGFRTLVAAHESRFVFPKIWKKRGGQGRIRNRIE